MLSTLEAIRTGRFTGVDSLVVVRHGKLVAEGYFNGYGPETLHDLRSTGKSFTSALAGIAIGQQLFALDDPIASLIPQFDRHANMDARKRAITIRNLLDMRSGLECNDWNSASRGNEERMYETRDWVGYILDLPMANDPGAVASYCTGGAVVLGHVIAGRSGMALDAYAVAYLFAPLGIQQTSWRRSPDGSATGGGGLKLRPRDAAKFGRLYLDGGVWNGVRVVPGDWVARSQERVTTLNNDGYGLLWWKRSFARPGGMVESFFTSGNGGNFIFVFPALDLVAVFTGSNYNSPGTNLPFEIVGSFVLPAVL
jgi:CubicO group peptidase (beta-lactamase class C family)